MRVIGLLLVKQIKESRIIIVMEVEFVNMAVVLDQKDLRKMYFISTMNVQQHLDIALIKVKLEIITVMEKDIVTMELVPDQLE